MWLQLHALPHNLGNILRNLVLLSEIVHWSLTTRREKLIKIGPKVVRHCSCVAFQLAEAAISRTLLAQDTTTNRPTSPGPFAAMTGLNPETPRLPDTRGMSREYRIVPPLHEIGGAPAVQLQN